MRRWAFHFAVAALAFGNGLLIVIYPFSNNQNIPNYKDNLMQTNAANSNKMIDNKSISEPMKKDSAVKIWETANGLAEHQEEQRVFNEFAEYEGNGSRKPYEKVIRKWLNSGKIKSLISLRTGEKPTEKEAINVVAEINLFTMGVIPRQLAAAL